MAAASSFRADRSRFSLRSLRPGLGFRGAPQAAWALLLVLLVGVVLSFASSGRAAGPHNLLAGLKPTRTEGVRNVGVLTDGARASDGDDWNTSLTAVFASGRAFAEYDLGQKTDVVAAYLQGDNNDRYVLSLSDDGQRFREFWVGQPVDRPGLQPRSASGLRGNGRYLRVSARDGDGAFSLSEVQVFSQVSGDFPPKVPAKGGFAQAPRVRTSLLIFALAWFAFLFATDRRSSWLWIGAAAVAPLAAGFSTYSGLWEGWPPGQREVSLVRAVSAAIALMALIRAATFRTRFPAHRVPVLAALSFSAALAFAGFYNLGQPQFWNAKEAKPEFVHTWDMRVYYPFTKYFEEIGYGGVYLASVAAYVEDVPGTTLDSIGRTEIRNLKTHKMQHVSDVKQDIQNISKNFSKERWAEFKSDMRYFREVMGGQYLTTHHDHGSNATPVWVLCAKLIFSGRPATEGVLVFGGLVDVGLLAAAFAAMWWAFGLVPALLSIVVFGANDFYMFGTNWGGATLRHDWLAYLAIGVALLKKERWVLGGVFFGMSTMIRAFPGAALIGVVLPAAWWIFERWGSERPSLKTIYERHQPAIRVLAGAAGCMLFTFALSSAILGLDAWVVWWKKITLLNSDVGLNDISLKSLVGGNDGAVVGTLNNRALVYWAAFFAALAAVGIACRARPLDQAATLALPLIPVLTNPANYYAHFIFVLPLLGSTLRSAPRKRARARLATESAAAAAAEAAQDGAGDGAKREVEEGAPPVDAAKPVAESEKPATPAELTVTPESESLVPEASTQPGVEAPADEPPQTAQERRRSKPRSRSEGFSRELVPLRLPHLAISGPLLALCVAQYWTVLDPDIERHFQAATAMFFAAMGFLYVRVLKADQVFDPPDAPPPVV